MSDQNKPDFSYDSFIAATVPEVKQAFRPSWAEYFMSQAVLVSRRSTCLRRAVGAVLVKENNVLSTGYNGAPSDFDHAKDVGCFREYADIPSSERTELCRGIHAEQNAITLAARRGTRINNSTLFCTHFPCITCQKLLIASGVKTVYYLEEYADSDLIRKEAELKGKLEFKKLSSPFIEQLSQFMSNFS